MTPGTCWTVLDPGPMRALSGLSESVGPERLLGGWRHRGFAKDREGVNIGAETDDDSMDENECTEVPRRVSKP